MKCSGSKIFTVGLFLVLSHASYAAPTSRFIGADADQPRSPLKLAAIDFLLPGYGTFTQQKTGYAAIYFGMNIANLGLMYLAYRNWRFYESAYQAAAARQATESDNLRFTDPTGSSDYLSLQDIKNRADRGQLFFALSIVVNVTLRVFSAGHTWLLANEAAAKAGPRYEFYPEERGGYRAALNYQFYF